MFFKSSGKNCFIFFISDGVNICWVGGVDICEWLEGFIRKNIILNVLIFLYVSLVNINVFVEYICLVENMDGEILYMDINCCKFKFFNFNLVYSCRLEILEFKWVECWGLVVKNLWGIFLE